MERYLSSLFACPPKGPAPGTRLRIMGPDTTRPIEVLAPPLRALPFNDSDYTALFTCLSLDQVHRKMRPERQRNATAQPLRTTTRAERR